MLFYTVEDSTCRTAIAKNKALVVAFDKTKNQSEVPNPDVVPELPQPSSPPTKPLEIPEPDSVPEIPGADEDAK